MNAVHAKIAFAACGFLAIFVHVGRSHAERATPPRPATIQQLFECRSISPSLERVTCYDAAMESLGAAERDGEIAFVERERVLEARRALFGFTLPTFPALLTGGETEPLNEIETTLARASYVNGSGWTFHLADGSIWRQIDPFPLQFRPAEGMPVRVRRAAMGSYLLKVADNPAVRAKRQ